jgi:hypothetical protein
MLADGLLVRRDFPRRVGICHYLFRRRPAAPREGMAATTTTKSVTNPRTGTFIANIVGNV